MRAPQPLTAPQCLLAAIMAEAGSVGLTTQEVAYLRACDA